MRLVNVTFEIEDNDLIEYNFITKLESEFKPKSIRVLPNTDHLKDNAHFKKMLKSKRDIQLSIDRYINENRNGKTT